MLVSEWCFELANIFAPLRERYLKLDTIPKPGGLGAGGSRVEVCASSIFKVVIEWLSSICQEHVGRGL